MGLRSKLEKQGRMGWINLALGLLGASGFFSWLFFNYSKYAPQDLLIYMLFILLLISSTIAFISRNQIAMEKAARKEAELMTIKAKDSADIKISVKQKEIERKIDDLARQKQDLQKKEGQIANVQDELDTFWSDAKLFVGATKLVSRTLNVLWGFEPEEKPPELTEEQKQLFDNLKMRKGKIDTLIKEFKIK